MERRLIGCLLCLIPLAATAQSLDIRVLDAEGEGLDGIVVYLEGGPAAAPTVAVPPLDIRQQDKRFSPYLGVTRKGADVIFSNRDDITHHIYSFNGPARFSFQLRPGETDTSQAFPEAGVIAMGCNIHDWMSGYLLVLDNPWFATTAGGGRARIADLPPGRYRAVAWHPQLREEPPARDLDFPGQAAVSLRLSAPMAEIPRQEDLNDFDFLESY